MGKKLKKKNCEKKSKKSGKMVKKFVKNCGKHCAKNLKKLWKKKLGNLVSSEASGTQGGGGFNNKGTSGSAWVEKYCA